MLKECGNKNPKPKQVKRIIHMVEICEQLAYSSTEIKKAVFRYRLGGSEARWSQKSAIGRAIRLSRNNVFPNKSPIKSISRRRIADSKKHAVNEFLHREDNGYILPDKKYYKKDREMFVVALVDSMRNLHRKFVVETGLTLSFSTFCKARDKRTVKTSVFLKRSVCLCKPHANMGMLLEVVESLPNRTSQLVLLSDDEVTEKLNSSIPDDAFVTFKRWEKESREYGVEKRIVYHTCLRKLRQTGESFKVLFLEELAPFRAHQARVAAQYEAIKLLKENLPEGHAIVQMDYAENWCCSFMFEIQSAFYGKDQITLHPMVIYTRQAGTDVLKNTNFVGVSEVTNHSFPTTLTFITKLMVEIRRLIPNLQHLHVVTDSPTSQYRNRYSCDMLRKAAEMFGSRITWNWLEAGHGKGPCDGIGGSLKGMADRVVKSSGSIQTADEFVDQLQPQSEKIHMLRVTKAEVDEYDSLVNSWESPEVKNISFAHQATVFEDQLSTRLTSCYKECCMVSGEGQTEFRPMCDGWTKSVIKAPSRPRGKPTASTKVAKTSHASGKKTKKNITRKETTPEPATPDPVTPTELEDVVGGNEAGLTEPVFSSDDSDIDETTYHHETERSVQRRKRRQVSRKTRSCSDLSALLTAGSQEDGSDDDSDPDYFPEPQTLKEKARNARIARERRKGNLVNELIYENEGETSSDDWPVEETLSLQKFRASGFISPPHD